MDTLSNATVAREPEHPDIGVDMNQIPEPWATAAEQAGIRQTLRGIADAARISHVTVGRLIGEGRTSPATITAVATALRVEPATVYEWAHVTVSDWGPWTPPAEAHLLTPRARAALAELILVLVEKEDGSYAEQWPPQKSDDGDEPPIVIQRKRTRDFPLHQLEAEPESARADGE